MVASMYAVYHGPDGLTAIARATHAQAVALADALRDAGVEVVHDEFFDTVLARVPGRAAEVVAAAREAGVHVRHVDADHVGAEHLGGHRRRGARRGAGGVRGLDRLDRRRRLDRRSGSTDDKRHDRRQRLDR